MDPITRKEQYLNAIAGGDNDVPETPQTREEWFLNQILENGGGGDPETIKEAVEEWLDEHIDPTTGYAVDDTLSIAGAAADAKAVGDELADVKSAFGNIENLFVDLTAEDKALNSNGTTGVQSGYKERTSDYIPVTGGAKYTAQIWATPPSNKTWCTGIYIVQYNSEKTKIKYNDSIAANKDITYHSYTITTEANCAYIRVCGRMFDDGKLMVTCGAVPVAYGLSVQDLEEAVSASSSAKNTAENVSDSVEGFNLFIRNDAVVGFIDTDGTIDDETAYREMTSDYIPVTAGDIITAQTWVTESKNLALRCVFFDSGKNVLSYTDKSTTGTTYIQNSYTIPASCAYIRIGSRFVKTIGRMIINRGAVNMGYIQSWQDIEARFTALNTGGAYGLRNPLLRPAYPRIAAHRGLMAEAPENTIPAFTLAGQGGAWGIETDVWETTDGYFILSHEDDVSRMTDGSGKISEMTYAETQECTIDAGANVGEYSDLKMPLLEDYLKICRRYGCVACIEIKGVAHYDDLVEIIRKAGMEGSAVLALYWDEATFGTLRELTDMPIMIVATGDFSDKVTAAQKFPDIWIDMSATYITAQNLQSAHDANIPVAGWTYETQSGITDAVAIGLDIAISGTVAKLT